MPTHCLCSVGYKPKPSRPPWLLIPHHTSIPAWREMEKEGTACAFVRVHSRMQGCKCKCMYMHVCIILCMNNMCVYVYVYVCMHVCLHVCMYACVYMDMYVCTDMYVFMYTYAYMCSWMCKTLLISPFLETWMEYVEPKLVWQYSSIKEHEKWILISIFLVYRSSA